MPSVKCAAASGQQAFGRGVAEGEPVADLRAAWRAHVGFGLANAELYALLNAPDRAARSPATEDASVRTVAVTFTAVLADLPALTDAERTLMAEWVGPVDRPPPAGLNRYTAPAAIRWRIACSTSAIRVCLTDSRSRASQLTIGIAGSIDIASRTSSSRCSCRPLNPLRPTT